MNSSQPSSADRLAALPEPLQQALVELVAAVSGMGQAEKTDAVEALSTLAEQTAEIALAVSLRHLEVVVDEVHTQSAPAGARAVLRQVKSARRAATALITQNPGLLHEAAAQLRIPTQRAKE